MTQQTVQGRAGLHPWCEGVHRRIRQHRSTVVVHDHQSFGDGLEHSDLGLLHPGDVFDPLIQRPRDSQAEQCGQDHVADPVRLVIAVRDQGDPDRSQYRHDGHDRRLPDREEQGRSHHDDAHAGDQHAAEFRHEEGEDEQASEGDADNRGVDARSAWRHDPSRLVVSLFVSEPTPADSSQV